MTEADRPELIDRARRGDADAIGALYDAHQAAIYRYVWVRVGERALAEDLTGDVFMRMLSALPRYQPSAAPFRAWLYRIAHNRLVDHFRSARGRATAPLEQAEAQGEPAGDPADAAEAGLTLARLRAALARIDSAQRDVVTLRFLAGLSLHETARALGKTEAAIKALQHRGLTALRSALAEQEALP